MPGYSPEHRCRQPQEAAVRAIEDLVDIYAAGNQPELNTYTYVTSILELYKTTNEYIRIMRIQHDEPLAGLLYKEYRAWFDCIWAPDDNHLRLVSDNGKFGLMNTSFTFDFPIIYDWIITLNDGNYYMIKDGIKKKVSPEGGVTQDFVVDHTWALKYPVGVESYVGEDRWGDPDRKEEVSYALSDYLGYRIDYGENYTFGVIHAKTGQVIVPALYDQIEMVSDKLFKAEDLNDRTYVLIDLEGRIIQERRK